MKEKEYISLRFIKKNQTLNECLSSLSPSEFLKTCETHARYVIQKNDAENS
jgi:hypothetical protein